MRTICVLINTYNPTKKLKKLLDDLACYLPGVKIALYDDGSNDEESKSIINEIRNNNRLILYNKNEVNLGLIETRNRAIFELEYDYVIVLDDDCRWKINKGHIEIISDFLKNTSLFAIALSVKEYVLNSVEWKNPCSEKEFREVATFLGGACIIDIHKFRKLGGYKYFGRYGGEELNISLRAFDMGWKIFGRHDYWCEHYPSLNYHLGEFEISKWKAELKFYSLLSNALCLAPLYICILIICRRLILGAFGLSLRERAKVFLRFLKNFKNIAKKRTAVKGSVFLYYFKLSRNYD